MNVDSLGITALRMIVGMFVGVEQPYTWKG